MTTEDTEIVQQQTATKAVQVCDCCGIRSMDEYGNEVDIGFNTYTTGGDGDVVPVRSMHRQGVHPKDIAYEDTVEYFTETSTPDGVVMGQGSLRVAVLGENRHLCDICDSAIFGGGD